MDSNSCGLAIKKRFSVEFDDPYKCVEWKFVDIKVTGSSGEILFELPAVEIPAQFSHRAEQTMVSKYFRITDVPTETIPIDEMGPYESN